MVRYGMQQSSPASKKNPMTVRSMLVLGAALAIWLSCTVFIGSDYPFNYDSVNYALAISEDFDIGKCQPHAWGYLYHIMLSRLWLPVIENPFRIQQVQNCCYLLFALLFMMPAIKKKQLALLVPATLPLSLFCASTAVIHIVSFTASAAIAYLIRQLEKRAVHPVVLTSALAVFAGFRQDLLIFLSPVVLFALVRYRCTLRQWLFVISTGAALTAVWYVATSALSGWLSPWHEAQAILKPFLAGTSLLYGAPLFESLRIIIRLFLYIPAVLGPGGILFLVLAARSLSSIDKVYLAFAAIPFFLYGILLYLGVPTYLSTVAGFVVAWLMLHEKVVLPVKTVVAAVALNLVFFIAVPKPLTEGYGTFATRSVAQSVVKQVSWCGAVGMQEAMRNRAFETLLDDAMRHIGTFSVMGSIEYQGIPYFRAWPLIAEHVWKNQFVADPKKAAVILGKKESATGTIIAAFDDYAVWKTGDILTTD